MCTNYTTRTGATGTIGAAVANEVLKAGYKVRAPTRSVEKGKILTEVFNKRYGAGSFTSMVIEDLSKRGALDEAMKNCVGVIHLVSEMSFLPDPHKIITPSVAFVNNALSSAAKTSSVKRFVYTSSQAVLPPSTSPGTITGSSWRANADELIAYAWREPYTPDKSPIVYTASKILAERACWEFVEREKPGFVLNIVIPGFSIGQVIDPRMISSSNRAVNGMLVSESFSVGFITGVTPSPFVNLEDAGLLHLAALALDNVKGQRLLALGDNFTFNDILDVLKKLAPGSNLPPKVDQPEVLAVVDRAVETELLKALGKNGFTGLAESVQACISEAKSN